MGGGYGCATEIEDVRIPSLLSPIGFGGPGLFAPTLLPNLERTVSKSECT
jgi:hypothetical protein